MKRLMFLTLFFAFVGPGVVEALGLVVPFSGVALAADCRRFVLSFTN